MPNGFKKLEEALVGEAFFFIKTLSAVCRFAVCIMVFSASPDAYP